MINIVSDFNSPSPDSEDSPDELAAMLTALAKLWDQGVLDFSETDQSTLPAQQPATATAAPVAAAQGSKGQKITLQNGRMKVTYGSQILNPKKAEYKDLKRKLLMSGMRL